MSVAAVAADVVMWIGRVVTVLPAFQALWQAIEGQNADQLFAAQLELTRQIRTQQAREEIEGQ